MTRGNLLTTVLLSSITVLWLSHCPSLAHATDQPEITLRIDVMPRSVKVAEPLRLQLVVTAPRGARVTFPQVVGSLGPFQVVDQSSISDVPMEGAPDRRNWVQTLTLESLDTGKLTIQPLEVRVELVDQVTGEASSQLLHSDPIDIKVVSLLTDDDGPEDFRGIKGEIPRDTAVSRDSTIKWIAIGAIPLLAIGLFLLRKSRRRTELSPVEWMQREVNQLESLSRSNQLSMNDTYAQLSAVLRRFLERETRIPAVTLSTPEICEALEQRGISASTLKALYDFLATSDEAKFSGTANPGGTKNERVWSEIYEISRQIHEQSIVTNRGE